MLRIRRELEQQMTIVKRKTIEFICNPFNEKQIEFVAKALNNPFLDMRYMSGEYVTMNSPYILAFIEHGNRPRVLYDIGTESIHITYVKNIDDDEIACSIIKSKNDFNLRDIVERDKLLHN